MNEAEETYSLLPLEECAVHPSARIRFDYANVEELAEEPEGGGPGAAGEGGARLQTA